MIPRAILAQPINLQFVVENLEPELLGGFVLKCFDIGVVKFDRVAALHADQVVMMLVVVQVLVSSDAICEIDLAGEPAIRKDLHRAIDCGVAHARIQLSNCTIDILNTTMPLVFEKRFEYELAMRSDLEFPILQVLQENLHFRRKRFHGAAWFGGNSLTTSLYMTITKSIKRKTKLT